MKIKLLAIALLAGGLLVGCDKDDNGNDPGTGGQTGNGGDIVFSIGIENPNDAGGMTRTVTTSDFNTTFSHGDEIGLYAVSHAAGVTGTTLAASGNAIHNVKLTYSSADGGKWTPETPLYYKGKEMDFYAYYPYSASATNPLNITFNVNADQSIADNYNKSDLLAASKTNVAKSNNPVTLTFAHRLALVQVEVDPTYIDRNGGFTATLRGCKAGGAFNLSTGTLTPAPAGDAVAVKMLRVEKAGDTDYETKYTYRALVPAQTVAQNTSLCLMTQNGQLYNTPTLAAALTLTVGNAKLYTATLPATAIQTVKITAGTFQMGSPSTEPNRQANETQHSVILTKDFYMSKYAVTFAQYDAFCDATGKTKPNDAGWGRGDRPVINVSWNDAVDYCAWLSEQTGQTWTLPTEAQWEYACRGDYTNKATETATLPFGIGDGRKLVSGMANYYLQYSYNLDYSPPGHYNVGNNSGYLGKTTTVGNYSANNYGLYDMHGNVWEWCLDNYRNDYQNLGTTDPLNPPSGNSLRVLRGGSWSNYARNCRSAFRSSINPDNAVNNFGFRVVLVP